MLSSVSPFLPVFRAAEPNLDFDADLPRQLHISATMHRMQKALRILARAGALLVEALVRFYQVSLSPLLIGSCKFHPSCSEYFAQAVREWGVLRGGWLGLKRLARCHPFGPGGLDPVPKRPEARRG